MTTVRAAAAALLVLLVTLSSVAACTGGDDDSPATTAAPAPASTTSAAAFRPEGEEEAQIAEAVEEVFALADFEGEPGCAVSAVSDGTLIFEGGFGVADLSTGEPITPATTFDIASVSKQFTAAAIYLLAEEGALSMDEDIREFVPELPDYGVTVTLDDLVHHSSGLTDYTELLGSEFDDTDVTTTEQALDAIVTVDELTFEPGTVFEYNNSNYFLLGLVVEDVTGLTLREFLEDEVFEPLGMGQTIVRDDASLDVADGAEGYAADGQGDFEPNTTNWEQAGDGAIWTSVRDLQRWAANLSSFEVGGPALREDLFAPGPVPDEDGYDYGGGLVVFPDQVEHTGEWAGFVSALIVRPDEETSVAVVCNRDDAVPYDLADRVLGLL